MLSKQKWRWSLSLHRLTALRRTDSLRIRANYRNLCVYLRSEWLNLAIGLVGVLGYLLGTVLLGVFAPRLVEALSRNRPAAIAQVLGVYAAIFLARSFFQFVQDLYIAKASLKVAFELRNRVYAHLQTLNFRYFETVKTGDLSYRVTEDVDRIGDLINRLFHDLVPRLLQLLAIPGYMLYLNWRLTVATVLALPLIAILIVWFGRRLHDLSLNSQNRVSDLSFILTEVFRGIRLVQAFATERHQLARFNYESGRALRAKYAVEQQKAIQTPLLGFLYAATALWIVWVGSQQMAAGQLTASGFISYLTAVVLLIDPLDRLTFHYNEFKRGAASLDRVFELLTIQPTVVEKPGAIELAPVAGKVEYRQVSFAYQPGSPTLSGINLTAMPGELIGLVGASGAGKTTLIHLLLRFYDLNSGQILIDGIDIRDVTLPSLRQQIGIVPQDTLLFHGTIAENIAFGQAVLDLDAIEQAARIANAHQFISQLPAGYQAWVGERGVNLSGGQRQKIAIARAALLNPKILILDEATSALDSESEASVQQAMERLMQGRTVFVIAHRLSTVRRCDRIVVLEQGRIVESGTHQSLLALERHYAKFYAQQFS